MRAVRHLLLPLLVLLIVAAPAALARDDSAERFAGKLLVADPSIADPRFARAVIYLVRHDDDGAFGLIVNKPLAKFPLAKLLAQLELEAADSAAELELYAGGPVQRELGFVLHSSDFATAKATKRVDDGFAVSGVRQVLRALADDKGPKKALFTIGYAGWGPDQLDAELARGDWNVIDADETLVFDLPVSEKWPAAHDRRALNL